jgi:anti-sigma regulatory factor (Ser/Thr protein kinase)
MTEQLQIALPPNSEAPSIARSFVVDRGAGLPADVVTDAELLVSELVSNAVLHGSPAITLRVDLDPPCIGVEVEDHGKSVPNTTIEPPAPTMLSGRGLMIVDKLSAAWGVTPTDPPPGKSVWFELGSGLN